MKLAGQRGIRSSKWVPNEMLHADDINFVSEAVYTNLTALLASIARPDNFGENEDIVMQGFTLNHNNLLTCDFSDGIACSFSGRYLLDGTWGFVASAGDIFSVVKPVAQSVAFTAGGTFARIDLLEVRPIRTAYDSKSRQFKDPITGLVTSSPIDTKYEYGYEFAVREGDDTSALTKEQTTWTVNTATVGSDIAGKYVLFSARSEDYYIWYNTGASGDPAVSGRTGIEVSINAGDDKDAIALATRTELNSHQLVTDGEIVISGATNQFIITVGYYVNVTDGTNGDMGSFFDAIAITQGNGVAYHTAGWIKIAEVNVGASASAITQNDILDVRDSDQWENESSGTRFVYWRAEEIEIEDAGEHFTSVKVEGALQEVGSGLRKKITVSENVDAFDPVGIADSKYYKCKAAKTSIITSTYRTSSDSIGLTSRRFVVAWAKLCRIGQYVDGDISWITAETNYTTNNTGNVFDMIHLGSDIFVIIFVDTTDGSKGKCRVGQYSGGSINWLTSITDVHTATTGLPKLADLGSNRFIAGYIDTADSNQLKIRVGEYSGGSVNWLCSEFPVSTGKAVNKYNLITMDEAIDSFIVIYRNTTDTRTDYRVLKYTTGTISALTNWVNMLTTAPSKFETVRLGVDAFVFLYFESGYLNAIYGRYMDNFISTDMGTVDQSKVFQLLFLAGSSVDYLHADSFGSNRFVLFTKIFSNKGIVSIGQFFEGQVSSIFSFEIAPESDSLHTAYLSICNAGANVLVASYVTTGDYETRAARFPMYTGIIREAVTSGNQGILQLKGLINDLSNLDPGYKYFVDYKGGTLSLNGAEQIGKALSSTELLLD